MTGNPLRLVVDHSDNTTLPAIELQPSAGGGLHIHLHMPSREGQLSSPAAVSTPKSGGSGRSGRGVARPLLIGVAGVLVAVVAFDLGARSAAGHAQALAAARMSSQGIGPSMAPPPMPQADGAPNQPLASIPQQLAQRPIVTPPADTDPQARAPNPFGLQN